MFFHRQIWLNRRTGDGHLWLHYKIEKQKTTVCDLSPPSEKMWTRWVGQSFIHSFMYSSISPSLYILPAYG
jgi:hypothetical protein